MRQLHAFAFASSVGVSDVPPVGYVALPHFCGTPSFLLMMRIPGTVRVDDVIRAGVTL